MMLSTKTRTLWRKFALFWLLQSSGYISFQHDSIKFTSQTAVLGFSPLKSSFTSRNPTSRNRSNQRNIDTIITRNLCLDRNKRNVKFSLYSKLGDDDNSEDVKSKTNKKRDDDQNLTMTPLDRARKKARARVELDRLTKGSDAIFDHEKEINKLVDGISAGLDYDTLEAASDLESYTLESKLAEAIKKGDFEYASQTRELMDRMHIDDCGFVLQLNSAFYKAFSEKDFEAMKALWMNDNTVQCIHPSNPPLAGYSPVQESWEKMFDDVDKSIDSSDFQMNTIEPTNIRLSVKGATAWLTCDEEIFMPKFVRGVGKTQELIKKMSATNIFRKMNGKWYIVHHHATWHHEFEPKKRGKKSISLGGLGGRILGSDSSDDNSSESSNGNGTVKRVFMGSLSDLLNGGLSDLLSDDTADTGNDDDNDNESGKTVIHVDAEYDQGDDSDDGDIIVGDDDSDNDTDSDTRNKLKQSSVPKDALRQNCISALRRLADQGTISAKQKRILLTDIISCSAKGEFSMVEVAYELLCGEGEDHDAAEEEFADQCRVLADEHKRKD